MNAEPEQGDNKVADTWGRWKGRWKVFIGKKHRKQWLLGGIAAVLVVGLNNSPYRSPWRCGTIRLS